jgi:hypothetical protein
MIIMKGKKVQKSWMENSPLPAKTRWAVSPNGWTDNELRVNYIKAFDEWTAHKVYARLNILLFLLNELFCRSGEGWRCLILDGHGSHLTYKFLQYAQDACIVGVGLPSHTTDFLQPLDQVIFKYFSDSMGKQ